MKIFESQDEEIRHALPKNIYKKHIEIHNQVYNIRDNVQVNICIF